MRIIIIGGGFSGLSAVRALKRLKNKAEIILFDKNNFTSMFPSLPDLACGKIEKRYLIEDIKRILPKKIIFINEKILSIDLFKKIIKSEKSNYNYDYLIITCGSAVNFYGFKKNIDKIYRLDSIKETIKLKEAINNSIKKNQNINIVLSGAGYTGLELAVNIRYFLNKNNKNYSIYLIQIENDILQFLNKKGREYIKSYLDKENIKILFNSKVTNFDGKNVIINERKKIEDSILIWTAGTKFSIDDIKGNFKKIDDGRIIINEYLQIPNYLDVFVAGDSAAVRFINGFIRKAVNFSISSGYCAGKNILRKIKNKKLKKFIPFDLGWVIPLHKISVGKLFGIIPIKGKIGLRLHYFMCGFRSYNFNNFFEYLKISLKLY